eukprot:7685419-Heterocapsa_arctica.AAC.1
MEEAEYPDLLCRRIAAAVAGACERQRLPGPQPKLGKRVRGREDSPPTLVRRAHQQAAGVQPRRGTGAPLVPEYASVRTTLLTSNAAKNFALGWKDHLPES